MSLRVQTVGLKIERKRLNICFQTVSGEGASVDNEVVDNWKVKVQHLIEGYEHVKMCLI